MPTIINDPYGGNIFGRLGRGFGQAISEQVPKEVERHRLSSGLKELGKQDFRGKNQLETLGEIYNIPGITPEIASLANQQVQKQNFLNRPGAQTNNAPRNENAPVAEKSKESPVKEINIRENGFASPKEITAYKSRLLQEPTQEEINSLADQYLNSGMTQDPFQAQQAAKVELGQNRAAQKEKIIATRTDLNNRVSRSLQGGGLGDYKDVAGEIQNALVDQAEYLVSNGMTPEAAAEKVEKVATELGKTVNKTKELGSFWNNLTKSSKAKSSDLRAQKKDFEKYGFGELFDDIAASSLGITRLQAAHVLDPLSNESISSEISKLKGARGYGGKEVNEKSIDSIIKNIKPKDNLFAIEYLLRDKGVSVDQFKERLSELDSLDQIALTPKQRRQLQAPVKQDFLGDILFQTF